MGRFRYQALTIALVVLAAATARAEERAPANAGLMGAYGDSAEVIKFLPPIPRSDAQVLTDGRRFPRLWLGTVRYEPSTRLTSYSVDDSLVAQTNLNYIFQIIPQLKTPKGETRDLPEGFYVMRMAVLLPNTSSDPAVEQQENEALALYQRFVTSAERVVQVTNGTIRTGVTFQFPFASATTVRNTLLVQIIPIEPNSLQFDAKGLVVENSPYKIKKSPYISSVIRIPFIPRFASGLATPINPVTTSDATIEDDIDLAKFIDNARLFQKHLLAIMNTRYTPEMSARSLGLDLVMSDSNYVNRALEKSRFTSRDLENLLSAPRDGTQFITEDRAEMLCRLALANLPVPEALLGGMMGRSREFTRAEMARSQITKCILNPGKYLQLSMQLHNLGLSTEKGNFQRGGQLQLNLVSSFATNRTQAVDTVWNFNAGFNPIDLWGVGRFGMGYSVNTSNSRSRFESKMLSGNTVVEVNFWDLKVHLNRFKSCLVVRANPDEIWGKWTTGRGLYICANREFEHVNVTERYYHAFPGSTSGPSVDVFDPRNQPVNMTVRGDRDYYAFIQSIHTVMSPTDNQKTVSDLLRRGLRTYQGLAPTQPGVIALPARFDGPITKASMEQFDNPTLMDRLLFRHSEDL